MQQRLHTCDAQLCGSCAVNAGKVFFRIRERGSFMDTMDYCPGHDEVEIPKEITGIQANAFRSKWMKHIRTSRSHAISDQSQLF